MNKLVLLDIDHTIFDAEKFRASNLKDYSLFKDVKDALSQVSKIAKLGIFSKGEVEFQKTKLKNTGIDNFFDDQHVHIFLDKILNIEVLGKYKDYKTFLVDDRLEVLQEAKKVLPSIFTIWIKQGPHAQKVDEANYLVPDKTILNFGELVDLVANN